MIHLGTIHFWKYLLCASHGNAHKIEEFYWAKDMIYLIQRLSTWLPKAKAKLADFRCLRTKYLLDLFSPYRGPAVVHKQANIKITLLTFLLSVFLDPEEQNKGVRKKSQACNLSYRSAGNKSSMLSWQCSKFHSTSQ